MTSTLRNTLRTLARTDAARIRELEAITGQKIRPTAAGAKAAKEATARVSGVAKGGKVAATLRAGLRELAQSDARSAREMASIVRDATPKIGGAKGGKAIGGGKPALPGGKVKATPRKPTPRGPGPRTRASRTAGTVAKPRGLKPGAVTAKVKAKAVAAKPAATTRPTINRTRKQAAAAQLDRKRQTLENTKAIRGKQSLIAPEGISRRSVKVNQRNMLTGGIDRVTAKVQTKVQGERISPLSSFGRKNTARSERASNRLDTLIQARRNTPKPRKATERAALAKIQKSISTVTRSFDSYRNARSGRRTKKS